MKKIFLFLVVFAFFACNKELIQDSNNEVQSINLEIDVDRVVDNFKSNYAFFESKDELSRFMISFDKLNDSKKEELVKSLKFKTINKTIDDYYEEMAKLRTEEEFQNLVNKSNGLFEIGLNDEGEKEVFEVGLTKHSIVNFLNENLIIKVGENYFKYYADLLIKSNSPQELSRLNSKEAIINSGLPFETSYKVLKSEVNSRWGEANLVRTWKETKDKPWCNSDRRVRLRVSIVEEYHNVNDPILGNITHILVGRNANVYPFRKGFPCIWFNYKTRIIWEDFDLKYKTKENSDQILSHHWVHANEDVEARNITRKSTIFAYIPQFGHTFDCMWTDIVSNITTRGIWSKWLRVNWHQ